MHTITRRISLRLAMLLPLAIPSLCWAQTALVVHDGVGGLSADVVSNLSTKLTNAGFTVSTNVGVPGSLAGFQQVWDVRYSNPTPLSGGDITAYVAYLNGGGSLFAMGENTGFATRNNSIIALVTAAGGGTITVAAPNSNTQTVQAPFTGPTAVTTVTFLAGAAAPSPANGSFITVDGGGAGIALVFGPGTMSNAPSGALLLVFDVNFLQAGADANLQALSDNMIGYLAAPSPIGGPVVPAPPTLILVLTGAAGAFANQVRRRRKKKAQAAAL